MEEEKFRKKLSQKQYDVLRNGATEAAFTGKLLYNKKAGIYVALPAAILFFHPNISLILVLVGRVFMMLLSMEM